jgi:hypothetical protein
MQELPDIAEVQGNKFPAGHISEWHEPVCFKIECHYFFHHY